jgi:hypothetical protein
VPRRSETAARGTGAADAERRVRSAELELGIAGFPRRRLACRGRYWRGVLPDKIELGRCDFVIMIF